MTLIEVINEVEKMKTMCAREADVVSLQTLELGLQEVLAFLQAQVK